MAKKVQLQTNGKEWQVIDGEQVLVDVEKQDIDPITSSSCVKIEGFRTLEEAVSDNKMLSQDLTYTKVMDKVGGDYHQNVLDGQYSKAILYGNTQVNLCEEDSSVALQIPTTFTSFNNGELQINDKENQVVAPLIKGVTMINLAQTNSVSLASSESVIIENVKGNTLYTLSFKFTTKNTNSGITIESYNGDTYLENAMHKTGLGDVTKFTFTVHADATVVKIVNNPAYGGETIQLDDIMLIEGDQTALDIPFFRGMESVELVRPLTNLFTDDLVMGSLYSGTGTNSNGTVTSTSTNVQAWAGVAFAFTTLKSNTKYLVMWDSLSVTQTSSSNTEVLIGIYHYDGTTTTRLGTINNNSLCPTKRSIIFDTQNYNTNEISLRVHATLSNTETGTTTVTGLRVFEYNDYLRSVDLQSIGWFSGTKNVAVEPIKTCSKNLYPYGDVSFTPTSAGWFDAKGNGNMYGDIAQKSKSRFLLKKGTYYLSMGEGTNISSVQLINDKEEMLPYTPLVLEQDTYLTIRVNASQANVATTLTNIQIERGETATSYISHDSRYYEPNGQNAIVLRSLPSGVCDTFNLQTGEYTRRIGEVVLNGSEEWRLNKPLGDGSFNQFVVNRVQAKKVIGQLVACDKLISDSNENKNNVIWIYDGTTIVIHSSCTSKDEFKTWLQQNPLTVQYEFRELSTTIIPRTIKRNNNGTVSTVDFKTYTNKENLRLPKNPSYLTINSMTSIKPVVEPITYIDFKTRLKANTDYSVIIDKDSINKTINLGGTSKTYADKMLVRTPSINLEQNLRISGGGSIQNIMVIEGDVLNKELPYFNGICNVKMPIVRNCGKNFITGKVIEKVQDVVVFEICRLKPNQQYIISSNYNFAQGRVSLMGKNNEFIIQDWVENKKIFKAPSDVYNYNQIRFWKAGLAYDKSTMYFQLEELESGTQATPYEPYRGNDICIVEDNVALRSLPNGVKDELNLLTGKYIQRVGEIVLDGSSDENIGIFTTKDEPVKTSAFYFLSDSLGTNNNAYSQTYISNSLNFNDVYTTDLECFNIHENRIRFRFLKEKATTIDECRAYLASNPITVQYELATPIISYPRIVSNTQEREVGVKLPNGICDTYNPSTGITVKRVGKAVLDGSEPWNIDADFTNVYRFNLVIEDMVYKNWDETISDKSFVKAEGFVSLDLRNQAHNLDIEHLTGWDFSRIILSISKNKVAEHTIEALKTYLSSNPITVWYELKHPIITTDIVLPNGVHDEYNPLTGLYTKRVGYIELDGSETWGVDPGWTSTENLIRFSAQISDMKLQYNNGHLLCDKLPVVQSGTVPCIYNRWNNYIFLDFSASDINVSFGTDSNEVMVTKLKTYLSQNPIKVWYELATPITYQLTPYFGLPMPYAYKDGYLIMDSAYDGQTLPPEITYQLTINRTGQITQNNIKLKEHTARLSNLEYILIEATLESIFSREMQSFELELMNIELPSLDE